jgi:hypothetical protein
VQNEKNGKNMKNDKNLTMYQETADADLTANEIETTEDGFYSRSFIPSPAKSKMTTN